MPHRGEEFGADLYRLVKAAKEDFPTVSAIYGEVLGHCDRVQAEVDGAMRRPEHFGGGLGPVHRAYIELHEAAVGLLADTRTNLDDTAAALHKAAQEYAETDQAAAEEMNRRLRADPAEPE